MRAYHPAPLLESTPPVLVIASQEYDHDEKDAPDKPDSPPQLVFGLVFGIVFGFLLQKGGVAKYDVLMGQFFLTDFTVIKVMLTAVVVGMVGIFAMRSMGLVKLHLKPTRYASNITGGLLFGVGLGLLGYCPGTGAAALGQGNRGRIMLPDLLGMRVTKFLVIFVPLLVGSLFVLDRMTG